MSVANSDEFKVTIEDFTEIWDELGQDERDVIFLVATRLLKGKDNYGDLDIDNYTRNPEREALEEDLDATVYRAIAVIKRKYR